jgi:hypothetical protein
MEHEENAQCTATHMALAVSEVATIIGDEAVTTALGCLSCFPEFYPFQ